MHNWLLKRGLITDDDRCTDKMIKLVAKWFGIFILGLATMQILPSYLGGIYYSQTGQHNAEQEWLNNCQRIVHRMYYRCGPEDKDLEEILMYVATRYRAIGPWDVMIFPVTSNHPGKKVIGRNDPLCPGITIDPWVFGQSHQDGALLLIHEALHDYWPCWGHDHVTPIMDRMEEL